MLFQCWIPCWAMKVNHFVVCTPEEEESDASEIENETDNNTVIASGIYTFI